MTHDHSHNNENVNHKNSKLLLWALCITTIFMFIEAIAGVLSGSLTLIADAGHMFADAFSLFLSWFAIRTSRKPKDSEKTYGYHRFQVIATFINGISLLILTIWIIYEALYRIYNPNEVDGKILFYVGITGLAANLIAFFIIRTGDHEDMNIKSAILHVLSDLLGSIAAIISGVIIIFTNHVVADPLLSLFVSLLLLKATFRLISESLHILMEGVPKELNVETIRTELMHLLPEANDIHHIHIWSLKAKKYFITFHITVDNRPNTQDIVKKAKTILHDKYNIFHSTIQVEYKECMDNEC